MISLTFAGADEEEAIRRNGAVKEIHDGAGVAMANQRH